MSGLRTGATLDPTTIDRVVSHDLYTYDAAVRDDLAEGAQPSAPYTFEYLLDDAEFVD